MHDRLSGLGKRESIVIRRDPNHFSKSIETNGNTLAMVHDEFIGIGKLLKTHFLSTIHLDLEEKEWRVVWKSFINHNIYNEHSMCRHRTLPEDYEQNFTFVSASAIDDLQDLVDSVAQDSNLFLHKTNTNINESANGMGHARANKRLNRTITGMFCVVYIKLVVRINGERIDF